MKFKDFLDKIPNDFYSNYYEYNTNISDTAIEERKLLLSKFLYGLEIGSIKKIKIFKLGGNYYPLEYDIELSILKDLCFKKILSESEENEELPIEDNSNLFFSINPKTIGTMGIMYNNMREVWNKGISVINLTDLCDFQHSLVFDIKRDISFNEYYKEKIGLYIYKLKARESIKVNEENLNLLDKKMFCDILLAYTFPKISDSTKIFKNADGNAKIANELIDNIKSFNQRRYLWTLIELDCIYEDLINIFGDLSFDVIFILARIYGYSNRNGSWVDVNCITDFMEYYIKNSNLDEMNNVLSKFKKDESEKIYNYLFNTLKTSIFNRQRTVNWADNQLCNKEKLFE